MNGALLVVSVFLACTVEAIEALTVVLAMGTARSWRSALRGVAAGLATLAAIIAVFGPALRLIPLEALRLVIGGLLLIFGLTWLRKAILRASGWMAPHDEDATFTRQMASARSAGTVRRRAVDDWYAFTLSFKSVVLEGLEVVFIVVTFGSNQGSIWLAVLGAVAAVLAVSAAGFAARRPLARVPENSLKFVVGVLLVSFGMFWGVEGAGADWPGADASLPVLIAAVAAVALAATAVLRRRRATRTGALSASERRDAR